MFNFYIAGDNVYYRWNIKQHTPKKEKKKKLGRVMKMSQPKHKVISLKIRKTLIEPQLSK